MLTAVPHTRKMDFHYSLFISNAMIVTERSKQRIPNVTAMRCQITENSLKKKGKNKKLPAKEPATTHLIQGHCLKQRDNHL